MSDQRTGIKGGIPVGKGCHCSLKPEYTYKGKVAWHEAVQHGTGPGWIQRQLSAQSQI